MRRLIAFSALAAAMTTASAATWTIGDNDGYGIGIPDGANHPFNGFTANFDGRSAAEVAATDGAQYTDTYSVTHGAYSPPDQTGSVATFTFSGLGNGWTEGFLRVDMADFQASTFGAVSVTFNGLVQNWAFNDGFPSTKIRYFNLFGPVLDSINSSGELVVKIDRNASGDFYGFDYMQLETGIIPEPGTYLLMGLGLGVIGATVRRRRA